MNGFRITILTLLCLSVGLMFYAVLFVIPSWQDQYGAYASSMRISAYEMKNDIHRQQMVSYDPSYEAPAVEQARLEEESAARQNELSVNEAEESNVIAAAKRKEEAARARAQQEEVERPKVIGIVASYDQEWGCIMVKPAAPEAFVPGTAIAVQRGGRVVCEAIVDNRDEESGQISATVKAPHSFADDPEASLPGADAEPAMGDEVILSPFPSASELRGGFAPQPQSSSPRPVEDADRIPPLQEEIPAVEDEGEQPTAAPQEPAAADAPESGGAEEKPAPAPEARSESVQRVLDSLPASPEPSQGSHSNLPSLDAMLHPSFF